jgi:hypothetical protein
LAPGKPLLSNIGRKFLKEIKEQCTKQKVGEILYYTALE